MITPPSRRRLGGWVPVLWFYNLWFLKLLGATTPCDWVQHAKHAAHVRHSFISQYMDNTKRQETIFHHCCMTHSVTYWDPSDPREGPPTNTMNILRVATKLDNSRSRNSMLWFPGPNGQQLSKMHVRSSSTKGILRNGWSWIHGLDGYDWTSTSRIAWCSWYHLWSSIGAGRFDMVNG